MKNLIRFALVSAYTLSFLASLTALTPAFSKAETFRIAVVDMDRVLNESKEAQAKRKELEKMKADKKKSLEAQRASLTKLESTLKEKKVNPESKEADEFRAKTRDFSHKAKAAEDELRKHYLTSTKTLVDKAQSIIGKYAEGEKLNLVLERGKEQKSAVLYSSNMLDITDEVIKRMNAS